jgi:hypothetical protein
MKSSFTYHPGTRAVGDRFKPVVRVFHAGKPCGSKTTVMTYRWRLQAELAAWTVAARAATKTGASVMIARGTV